MATAQAVMSQDLLQAEALSDNDLGQIVQAVQFSTVLRAVMVWGGKVTTGLVESTGSLPSGL